MRKLSNNSSGQALLMVLLSMSVVLTIVLSILARSTVDIGVSSRSEESVRAFSAAEAGIEQALVAGSTGDVTIGDATFNASVTDFSSGVTEFVLPSSLYSGESATVWFVSHDDSGNLLCSEPDHHCFTGSEIQVCWGKDGTSSSSSTTPAIEASIIYLTSPGNYTTARIARAAIDPYTSRTPPNTFSATDGVTCQVDGQTFAFSKTINMAAAIAAGGLGITTTGDPGSLQLARISLLYNTDMGHPVAVNVPAGLLPAQGVVINSVGRSDVSGTGGSTRKVEVIRGFKELPGIFENVVFSTGGITI